MGLIELFGESHNPGPVGSIENRDPGKDGKKPPARTVLSAMAALAVLAFCFYLIVSRWEVSHPLSLALIGLGFAIYLVLGYFIHPKPDTSNIGWLGGLIDHPFRYSDDLNRFLIFLVIVLFPGRLIAESLVDVVLLYTESRRSVSDDHAQESRSS